MVKVTERDEKAAQAAVALDDAHHTQYHIMMTPGEAIAYIRGLTSYNCFDIVKAEELIHNVVSVAPPIADQDGPEVEFVVGAEYSQVIYACVSNRGNKLYDDFQFQGWFIQEMERIGRLADADESTHCPGHPFWGSDSFSHFCWRFWWD